MPVRPVGTGEDKRLFHEGGDVFLIHVERCHRCVAAQDDLDRRQHGVRVLRARYVVECFPDQLRSIAIGDEQRLGPPTPTQVVAHFRIQSVAVLRIGGSAAQRIAPTSLGPTRQQRCAYAGAACGIGILIGRHLLPGGARRPDHGYHAVAPPPHVEPQRLDVGDVHWQPRLTPDAQRLGDRA